MRVSIRIDDGEPVRRRARSVLIANVGRLQGGVRLLMQAEPDDGLLDVAVLTPRTLGQWTKLAWAVIRHRSRVPSMEVFRGVRVEVVSDRPQPRQLDGDLIDAGRRLFAEVVPRSLWLCVPQHAGHPDLARDADAAANREASPVTDPWGSSPTIGQRRPSLSRRVRYPHGPAHAVASE
jgi:diacylglycerol kinase family enzyme